MRRMRAAVFVVMALAGPAHAWAQPDEESLAAARQQYVDAAYADALSMLERLEAGGSADAGGPRREILLTRALCLLALDRDGEARASMEALVDLDPFFDLDPAEASPRVRDLLRGVRAERLPAVVRERYATAKQAFDDGNFELAGARFAELRRLLADPVLAEAGPDSGLADLGTLVNGFADLSAKLQQPATPAGATPGPSQPPAGQAGTAPQTGSGAGASTSGARPQGTNAAGSTASKETSAAPTDLRSPDRSGSVPDAGATDPAPGQAGTVDPVAIERPPPVLNLPAGRPFKATVLVTIDEAGKVASARIVESDNILYNVPLLDAVRRWRYQPGTRDGIPSAFTKVVAVTVDPQ